MLLVWPTSKYGNAVNAAKPNWKISPSLPWLICSGIYNIALNLKETAKVPRTPGKTTAQDLGRSSSDEQITCNWTGRWVSIPLPQNQLGQPAWRQELGGCRIQGLAGPGSAPLGGLGDPVWSGGSRATQERAVGCEQLQFTVWQQWEKGEHESKPRTAHEVKGHKDWNNI